MANRSLLFAPVGLLALQAGLVQVHGAAVDYFLKIDGITGESTDSDHKGWIELESFNWGASNPTTIGIATGGAGAGKVTFSSLSVQKVVDKSSVDLIAACASGQHIKGAVLEVVTHAIKFDRKAGGEQEQVLLRLTLTEVLVPAVQEAGLKLNLPTESLSLNFGKIEISNGGAAGGGGTTGTTTTGVTTGVINTVDETGN
jgi:type VI secretion system secreted protein Hcp